MSILSKDVRMMLTLKAVRSVTEIFLGVFLIAHFLNISDDNVVPISLYNMVWAGIIATMFVLMGDFVKRKNKLISFRISAVLNIVYLLSIIFLKEKIIDYIVFFGLLYGISVAAYAFPFNILISEKVGKIKMARFIGYSAAIGGSISVLMPLVFGIFLTVDSYEKTAQMILFFPVLEILISLLIKNEPPSKESFKLKDFLKSLKKDYLVKKAYFIEYLRGLSIGSGALNVTITLYVIHIFKTNLNLGIFTSVFAFFTILLNVLFGRYVKRSHFPTILVVSMIFTTAGSVFFVANPADYSLIFYNFCFATAVQLLNSIVDVNLFNISNNSCIKDTCRIEYFVAREIFLNLGRVTSFILLFSLAVWANFEFIKYLLLFLTLMVVLVANLSIRLNKEISDED